MVICFAEEKIEIKRPLLPIPGSKWYLSRHLLKMIPLHTTYVEVFGGGAVLLLRKPPSPAEVYNDIDGDLVNLFRVVRDEEKFKRFYELVSWTLYSREEFNYAKEMLKRGDISDVERAYYFFMYIHQSFGRTGSAWAYEIKPSQHHPGVNRALSWFNLREVLGLIHQRLARVQIENDDFRKIIPRYDRENTFFYLDPPYYPHTRSVNIYRYEMTEADYEDLFNLLLQVKGKVLLSGFYHPAYGVLEKAGWQRIDIPMLARWPQNRGLGKIESLWFNYELPQGGDFK
jgi:DNA adenine methylase